MARSWDNPGYCPLRNFEKWTPVDLVLSVWNKVISMIISNYASPLVTPRIVSNCAASHIY
jgi:hypothetical protein